MMKLKVIIDSFGGIFILAIILVIRFNLGLTPYEAFMGSLFFVSVAVSVLLSDNKYIHSLTLNEGSFVITYMTMFLKVGSTPLKFTDITEVRLSKRLPIAAIWPPVLKIKINNQWVSYYVLSRGLYNEIQQDISSANIAFVK